MQTVRTKVLIIGSGPAGYSAAIYTARANLHPLLVSGEVPGGQLTTTTDVENYPGFGKAVQGPDLMEEMRQQAEAVGTEIRHDTIISIDLSKTPVQAIGESGHCYVADTLVIATGATARWLGQGEQEFGGYGVSACATCDGVFFRDREVAVVGGGNTAMEEALYLSNLARKITVIHRRDRFRAEAVLQDRLFAQSKVEVLWDHAVEEIFGEYSPAKALTGLRLRNLKTGDGRDLSVDGLFVAIGHDPNTGLFRGLIEMDEAGYIKLAPWSTATSLPFVWAAGDCADFKFRQAVLAAGMGCMAGIEVQKYLSEHGFQ